MADVKIVDIDGSQWNMKDQEARNKIAELEEKTNVTKVRLWTSNKSFIDKVKINGEDFLQVYLEGFRYSGGVVEQILTLPKTIGNTVILRCQTLGDLHPSVDRISVDLAFYPDNSVVAIVLNQGIYDGGNFDISLYGNAFIKII